MGGDRAWLHGVVTDTNGKPIAGALLDIWHDAPNGLYDAQDPEQPDYNHRGKFYTDSKGQYNFYCLLPTCYPIPYDGPAGELLQMMDRHPMRPSHVHVIASGPGYRDLVTQIFSRHDKYIESDSVFAVKPELIVDYQPATDAAKKNKGAQGVDIKWELEYNFKLAQV